MIKKVLIISSLIFLAAIFIGAYISHERNSLSMLDFLKAIPKRYSSGGLLQIQTEREIHDQMALFYTIKFQIANNENDYDGMKEYVEQIIYCYEKGGNTEQLITWKKIEESLK